jgi:hypothetical protein
MKYANGYKFKIGAWISNDTKRRADLYRALSGRSLQDIYEEALNQFLDKAFQDLGPSAAFPVIQQNDL